MESRKIISCIRRDENGKILFPLKMRNQNDIHPGSCLHHALCPTIEGMHLDEWKKKGNSKANDNLSVYVVYLIRNFRPAIGITSLLNGIIYVKNWSKEDKITTIDGKVRDETLGFDNFKLTGFVECDVRVKNGAKDLEIGMEHLRRKLPAIGIFSVSPECKPGRHKKIFVGNNESTKRPCPVCRNQIPSRHVVCVTGTAEAIVDGDTKQVFQYIESDNPVERNQEGDGVCYMTVNTMERIYILKID